MGRIGIRKVGIYTSELSFLKKYFSFDVLKNINYSKFRQNALNQDNISKACPGFFYRPLPKVLDLDYSTFKKQN